MQLSDHQKTHDLYEVSHQVSVYRQLHSAETALFCYLVDNDLLQAGDTPVGATLALIDLSAACDTTRHHRSRHTPESKFGIKGKVFDWFQSYLSVSTQTVLRLRLVS